MLIDAIVIVLMIVAAIKGYRNGLVVAAFSFLGIIVGLAAAMKLSAVVAGHLKESTHLAATWLPFISFALIMIAVLLLVRLGAAMVQTTLELAFLGWANKLAGMVVYACLYTVLFSVILFFAEHIHLIKEETIRASKTYAFIQPWGPKAIDAFGVVIPVFKGLFAELSQFFEDIGKKMQ